MGVDNDIIYEAEADYEYVGKVRRTIRYVKTKYVLTAFKYASFKELFGSLRIDYSVGYLIDNEGNITRDLSQALVIDVTSIVDSQECLDSPKDSRTIELYYTKPRLELYKNGLFISLLPYSEAQKFLNDHPLPRKSISKLTRLNVYAKYNGHCAYCGCPIELNEMQTDHFVAHHGEGGEDTLDNYMPSCEVCNRIKSNRTIEGFREAIRGCGKIHRGRKKPIMADSDKIAIKYGLTKEDHEVTFYFEDDKNSPKIDVTNVKKIFEEEN